MLLRPLFPVAGETHQSAMAISPLGVGGLALGILLVMLVAILMFGKGREHS